MCVFLQNDAQIELATQMRLGLENGRNYLESKALWFNQVQRFAIDSDQALSFCAQGNSGGGFLREKKKYKKVINKSVSERKVIKQRLAVYYTL